MHLEMIRKLLFILSTALPRLELTLEPAVVISALL